MNKTIIISGGTSGLGLELVKDLITKGYTICDISTNKEKLEELDFIYKDKHISFWGDITDENFIIHTISKIKSLSDISIVSLINNASRGSFKDPIDYKKEDIDRCFEGVEGMILLTKEVLKMVDEKDIKIINIMSSAALKGSPKESVYCASKWAQRGYTESLKAAYKGTSVKVIGVYPGGMNTRFFNNSRDYVSEEKQETFMDPKDVASVIVSNVFNDINLTVADLIIERN